MEQERTYSIAKWTLVFEFPIFAELSAKLENMSRRLIGPLMIDYTVD